jgi:hypothetical protein
MNHRDPVSDEQGSQQRHHDGSDGSDDHTSTMGPAAAMASARHPQPPPPGLNAAGTGQPPGNRPAWQPGGTSHLRDRDPVLLLSRPLAAPAERNGARPPRRRPATRSRPPPSIFPVAASHSAPITPICTPLPLSRQAITNEQIGGSWPFLGLRPVARLASAHGLAGRALNRLASSLPAYLQQAAGPAEARPALSRRGHAPCS